MKWMQGSIKIINGLDQLIQVLTWAERNVLSPLIIPTSSLLDMLVYVGAHLEQNTTLRLIPATVNEIHKMVTFYMVSIKGTLLLVLDIPLSSYPGPLKVYKVRAHPIRVPSSALDSVLELEFTHVAIHRETGLYVVLSAEDVHSVKTSRRHLLQYPVVRKDANMSCVMALYYNDPGRVKRLCTYIVRPTAVAASVQRLDTHFLHLSRVPNYSIRCQLTVHHDQLVVSHRLIHYKCENECSVDLQLFNKTGIIRLGET